MHGSARSQWVGKGKNICIELCKQAISIKPAKTVGHFLCDLDVTLKTFIRLDHLFSFRSRDKKISCRSARNPSATTKRRLCSCLQRSRNCWPGCRARWVQCCLQHSASNIQHSIALVQFDCKKFRLLCTVTRETGNMGKPFERYTVSLPFLPTRYPLSFFPLPS